MAKDLHGVCLVVALLVSCMCLLSLLVVSKIASRIQPAAAPAHQLSESKEYEEGGAGEDMSDRKSGEVAAGQEVHKDIEHVEDEGMAPPESDQQHKEQRKGKKRPRTKLLS